MYSWPLAAKTELTQIELSHSWKCSVVDSVHQCSAVKLHGVTSLLSKAIQPALAYVYMSTIRGCVKGLFSQYQPPSSNMESKPTNNYSFTKVKNAEKLSHTKAPTMWYQLSILVPPYSCQLLMPSDFYLTWIGHCNVEIMFALHFHSCTCIFFSITALWQLVGVKWCRVC